MRREYAVEYGGPNGGTGGRGGSIYLRCSEGLNTLAAVRQKVHYRATDGQNGQGKSRTGTGGKDIYIRAPVGTVVRDQVQNRLLHGLRTDQGFIMVLQFVSAKSSSCVVSVLLRRFRRGDDGPRGAVSTRCGLVFRLFEYMQQEKISPDP